MSYFRRMRLFRLQLVGLVLCCQDVEVLRNGVQSVEQARGQLRSTQIESLIA